MKAYAEQGYGHAVEIDLSKHFDTLNHELLINLLRNQIKDKRVTDLIKKYLKNRVRRKTEEGSPKGGPLAHCRKRVLQRSVINKKLTHAGYYDFPAQYERLRQLHLNG
ncbi:reverse transcriptase domain-containing protein [Paenibacillus polymyxa]|uniref:reverse transcriptase domain-containing protein n=1 Tax=Paenibacillus polymyxa TaxID=1406 RepID=UPI0005CF6A7F|nr:reverse transcriptase domain-containing protein [Paenibacillus polymyxa]KJD38076.1 hypothetical protein QD46_21395 [Paenibacillus polymyxa]MEE4581022.1 reverse transcriptase domain-containing protein [Paenibacillus polymyxa]